MFLRVALGVVSVGLSSPRCDLQKHKNSQLEQHSSAQWARLLILSQVLHPSLEKGGMNDHLRNLSPKISVMNISQGRNRSIDHPNSWNPQADRGHHHMQSSILHQWLINQDEQLNEQAQMNELQVLTHAGAFPPAPKTMLPESKGFYTPTPTAMAMQPGYEITTGWSHERRGACLD